MSAATHDETRTDEAIEAIFASPMSTAHEVADRIADLGGWVQREGVGRWTVQCPHPGHADVNPSASLKAGRDGTPLIHCFACVPADKGAWFGEAMRRLADGTPFATASPRSSSGSSGGGHGELVTTYDYLTDTGVPLVKARYVEDTGRKSFTWSRIVGDAIVTGLGRTRMEHVLPYRAGDLPDDLTQPVLWVEGEKDVDAAWAAGWPAITSGGGASGPLPGDVSALAGRVVWIVPDNDDAGRGYARRVHDLLTDAGCTVEVRWSRAEGKGADLSDHLEAGHSIEDLRPDKSATRAGASPGTDGEPDDADDTPDLFASCECCGEPVDGDGARCTAHQRAKELASKFGRDVLPRSALAGLPPTRYMIAGVKPTGTNVSAGSYGTLKSFTELSMALCVATGRKWMGREVVQGRVLFIVGEGASGLHRRIRAWEVAYNGGAEVSDDVFHVKRKPDSLAKAETWEALIAYAVEGEFDYIVIDTFSSTAPEADETKDAARILAYMTDLSIAVDGCVTLVHHAGWGDKTRVRGGSQIESNADGVLIYSLLAEGSLTVGVTVKKLKEDESGGLIYLHGVPVDIDEHKSPLVMELVRGDELGVSIGQRITSALESYGETGASGPALLREIDAKDSAFYKALNALRRDGAVRTEVTGDGRPKRGSRWWLSEHAPKGTG